MQYTKFKKLDFNVSRLGLGCMRLPMQNTAEAAKDNSLIDEAAAIAMIRHAIDQGVNYVDTAYAYHDGKGEIVVGKALKDGYREKVKLTTKSPSWLMNKPEDFERIFNEQLGKLQVDYVDFYLLHALGEDLWPRVKKLGVFDFLDRQIKAGKIKNAGFSFHGELATFNEIIDSYDWKLCQIQLNLIDTDYQAGLEGMQYAASKGIPVVVMEPVKGGSLAKNVPQDIMNIWNEAAVKRTPVDWALRWLCNMPEVTLILNGVSDMNQLKENLKTFETALPGSMSASEQDLVKRVQQLYKEKIKVGCTSCSYCMPCPSGVAIPDIFGMYNNSSVFGNIEENCWNYKKLIKDGRDASKCVECGNCESICPQRISIIEKLKEADSVLNIK
jgi:predicted aldo/keto reductase-like oxidoreductase